MAITLHHGDIPADLSFGTSVAIDTEAMGLINKRDRLCLVQMSAGDGNAHLVKFKRGEYNAPNLKKLLADQGVTKIFHFARFDYAILKHYLGVECTPLYCTKIASQLCRTYTDKHNLRVLCQELLGIELNKQQQSSDWGSDDLSEEQKVYAANDVLHLHAIKARLDMMLKRENRLDLAQATIDFIPTRAALDLEGWPELDIFAH